MEVRVFCLKPLVQPPPPGAVSPLPGCRESVFKFPAGSEGEAPVLCYLYLSRAASVSAGLSPGLCWDLHAGNGAVPLDLLLRGPGWSWLLTPATWSYSLC